MRREFLKGYLFALIAEGEFESCKSPRVIAARAMQLFAQDLKSVMGEMAAMALEQGSRRMGSAILEKMDGLAKEVSKRGFGAVWGDLQAMYRRGMDVNRTAGQQSSAEAKAIVRSVKRS